MERKSTPSKQRFLDWVEVEERQKFRDFAEAVWSEIRLTPLVVLTIMWVLGWWFFLPIFTFRRTASVLQRLLGGAFVTIGASALVVMPVSDHLRERPFSPAAAPRETVSAPAPATTLAPQATPGRERETKPSKSRATRDGKSRVTSGPRDPKRLGRSGKGRDRESQSASSVAGSRIVQGRVRRVGDGDTIYIGLGSGARPLRVDLAGVDAPASGLGRRRGECSGSGAHVYTRERLARTVVRVVPVEVDRARRRLVGYVYTGRNELFNRELVAYGYARSTSAKGPQAHALEAAEAFARRLGRGVWDC